MVSAASISLVRDAVSSYAQPTYAHLCTHARTRRHTIHGSLAYSHTPSCSCRGLLFTANATRAFRPSRDSSPPNAELTFVSAEPCNTRSFGLYRTIDNGTFMRFTASNIVPAHITIANLLPPAPPKSPPAGAAHANDQASDDDERERAELMDELERRKSKRAAEAIKRAALVANF